MSNVIAHVICFFFSDFQIHHKCKMASTWTMLKYLENKKKNVFLHASRCVLNWHLRRIPKTGKFKWSHPCYWIEIRWSNSGLCMGYNPTPIMKRIRRSKKTSNISLHLSLLWDAFWHFRWHRHHKLRITLVYFKQIAIHKNFLLGARFSSLTNAVIRIIISA